MSEISEVVFSVRGDIQFIRIQGGQFHGSVQVCKTVQGARQLLVELDPAQWASVVATMSALGENGTTFRMFEAMQK